MIEKIFLLLTFSPFIWMMILAVLFFGQIKVKENILSESVKVFSLYMVGLALSLFVVTWIDAKDVILLDYHDWISVEHYRFKIRFIIDTIGTTYGILTTTLIGIIFRFSRNYLHREEGYFRFIFILSTLMFGLLIVSFARSLDLLFIGWELAGIASVLLISYFYEKPRPVVHSIKAIISYRIADMGILAASALAHHFLHTTDFTKVSEHLGSVPVGSGEIFIGLFIIWGTLAKSGQFPLSSWLPTAMEGPTPSSAIFYGALSIHLGPFLLLRFYDYLSHFPSLLILIGVIGTVSAFYASWVGRTRSDAKTMLAYATISQVGIIFVEIALGFTNFALFHIVTHASMRTYQFLRSSSLIQDFYENPVLEQNVPIRKTFTLERFFSKKIRQKFYVHALHGFHLDYFTGKVISFLLLPMTIYMKFEAKWMEFDTQLLKLIFRKK